MKLLKRFFTLAVTAALSLTALGSCANNEETASFEKKQSSKVERLPGIVCWGSSIMYGSYGKGKSIEKTIESHMMSDECYIPIVNLGVPRESTQTIMARAGATKVTVDEFTIPKGIEAVDVTFMTSDKSKILPLKYNQRCDGGMRNVTIGGVEGVLEMDDETSSFEDPLYTFTRKDVGEEVKIKKGTQIISESMTEYKDYIPVICMGESGLWDNDPKKLIQQQQAVLNTSNNKDKFVIIGLFSSPMQETDLDLEEDEQKELVLKRSKQLDKALQEHWGDHYVNIRELLCSDTALKKLEKAGVEVSDEDKADMAKGIVPKVLKTDQYYLNGYAYDIIGDAVYEKLVKLGYLYH